MATPKTRAGIQDAKTAKVDSIVDDMFSLAPKGSYIEWYTDLYNLGRQHSTTWSHEALPALVANGVKARLVSDPSLARLEGRVKRATNNITNSPSRDRMKELIEVSFSTAKATCRSKALAWKMFTKSREARGLPKDLLGKVRALV